MEDDRSFGLAKLRRFNLSQESLTTGKDLRVLSIVQFQIAPSVIITSARSEDHFIAALAESDNPLSAFEMDIRPSTDFIYATAKNKLLSLRIRETAQAYELHRISGGSENRSEWNRNDMMFYLESVVSLDNREMVGCAGALLNYVTKAKLTGVIIEHHGDMEVSSVEQFSIDQFMHVNADAIWSLQIFQDAAHPNIHSRRSKEGLSLFGILNSTKTPLGRGLLRQWFLRPSIDIVTIEERQNAVSFFLKSEFRYEVDQLRACLMHVKDIPRILVRMRLKTSTLEWEIMLKFAYHTLKIRGIARDLGSHADIPLLDRIRMSFLVAELKEVGSIINNTVDFDASLSEARFVVKPDINEELDELKRTYHGLDELLSEVAHEISVSVSKDLVSSLNVIYFPQLGYLITIPLKEGMTAQEDFAIDGLFFQFCTSSTVYYKSDRMFELDETLGDIHSIIADREIEIMQRLQETVLKYAPPLIRITEVCAELDCLLSLAEAARKYNYVRPQMTEQNVLHIVKGRHPLQELCVDTFVPNDISIGEQEDFPRMILLTGANFSGKSVYLKQIAVITLMAHIGSFVPAVSAVIGICDKILTRIHTRETVSKTQSSFMIDLLQVSNALRTASERSLVLLDEFGKGTQLSDGIGLSCAVLESFAQRKELCPKILTATHFHEVYTHDVLNIPPDHLLNCNMEIVESEGASVLTFLYRYCSAQEAKVLSDGRLSARILQCGTRPGFGVVGSPLRGIGGFTFIRITASGERQPRALTEQDLLELNGHDVRLGAADTLFSIRDWNVDAGLGPLVPPSDLLSVNPSALDQAYVGVWGKLTRTFVTNIIFSLVVVLYALVMISQAVTEKGEQVIISMQRACTGLEVGATALASLPHYAADGLNSMTINGINGIVQHTSTMLVGFVVLLNQLILMVVERYTGLLACILDVIVQLAVGTVAYYAAEIVDFINTQIASIESALTASLAILNNELQTFESDLGSAINTIANVFGGTVNTDVFAPVTFPGVTRRLDFSIPTDFIATLQALPSEIPSLASLEAKLASLISEPFGMLESLIEEKLGDLTGISSSEMLVAVPDPSARVTFCDASMNYEWVYTMVGAINKALSLGIYLIIALMAATVLANIIVTIYDHYAFEREVKSFSTVLQGHRELNDKLISGDEPPSRKQARAISRDLIHAATRPTLYLCTTWFTRAISRSEAGSIRFRWFIDYVSHPPSLICFMAGLSGIAMILLQIWMIQIVESTTTTAVASSASASMDKIVGNVELAMVAVAQPYVDGANARLSDIEYEANHVLFGWVNTTMNAINSTIFVFADGLSEALDDVFDSVPPLQTALNGFVYCVLGSNIQSLEAMASGLRSHAQLSFPRINLTSLLALGTDEIEAELEKAEQWMTGSSSTTVNVTVTSTGANTTATATSSSLLSRRSASDNSTAGNSTDTSSSDSSGTTSSSYFATEAEAFLKAYEASLRKQLLPFGALMGFGSIVMIMGSFRLLTWFLYDCIRDWRRAAPARANKRQAKSSAAIRTLAPSRQQSWFSRFKPPQPRGMKQRVSGDSLTSTNSAPPNATMSAVSRFESESSIGNAIAYRPPPTMITNVLRTGLLLPDSPLDSPVPVRPLQALASDAPPLQRARTAPSGPRTMNDFPPLVPRATPGPVGPRPLVDAMLSSFAPPPSDSGTSPLRFAMTPLIPVPVRPSAPPSHPYTTSVDAGSDEEEQLDWNDISREAAQAVAFLAAKARRVV
ncbi:MutS protein msh5 [Thoreauomyces humboldtii]|nr:MutS protein msh5 [Thoreauomyces humboldtii]